MTGIPLDHNGPTGWPFEPLPESTREAPIGARFAAVAAAFPNRVAVQDRLRALSYRQLETMALRVARAVLDCGPEPGPIAILLRHEARFPAAMLGVMAAGRACVPLDADHPVERNRLIAAHSAATAIITTHELAQDARALFSTAVSLIVLDDCGEPPDLSVPTTGPEQIACILYTSGSTGTPKGVYQDHRGVLHDVAQSVHMAHFSSEDRIALFYPPTVIAGLRTMLSGLLVGAGMHVLPPTQYGRNALVREIDERRITVLRCSPTLFRHLVEGLEPGARLDSVRLVSLGGERVGWGDYDVFARGVSPRALFSVHLGATECWTLHTHWYVDPALRTAHPALPVGYAMPDRETRIVDEDGQPVPDGMTGEIVVSSPYIARGYWREPGLTAGAFAADPHDARIRCYRTGDLARRLPGGLVEFLGRKDQQIKLHGYRIEIGEVEAALKGCAGVSDAAVLVRRDGAGSALALIGYAQLRAGVQGLLPRHLLAMLSQRLAAHMMPAEVVIVDSLPWLANFKIDRRRLALMDAAREVARSPGVEGALVQELSEIFARVLKIGGATASDNLLTMGGDSLQALQLVAEIERHFGVTVTDRRHSATRTLVEWARQIAAGQAESAAPVHV